MISGISLFAQKNIAVSTSTQAAKVGMQETNWKSKIDPRAFNAHSLLTGDFHYFLQWATIKADYEQQVNNVPVANFTQYTNTIFMDSTAKSSNSTSSDYVFNCRAGMVIDPKSPYYDPNFGGTPLLTKSDPYTVDTILIAANYQKRVTEDDTLYVELTWGDTSASVWSVLSIATAKQFWVAPKLNFSKSDGNVSHITGAANKKLTIKRVLTADDTVTVNNPFAGYIVVVVPTGAADIPANALVAVTYTYVPSVTYTKGDVVFEYATPVDPATQNGLGGRLIGQTGYDGTNGKSYYYDSNADHTKNTSIDYYKTGRYGKYTSAGLNSVMLPGADFCWYMGIIISNTPVGIREVNSDNLQVAQNVPNPFTDNTAINFELVANANVNLAVYDITGKKVQAIEAGRMSPGTHSIQFNAGNLQAGVYFYTLTAGEAQITKRMNIIK